jgi:hypothetical protein
MATVTPYAEIVDPADPLIVRVQEANRREGANPPSPPPLLREHLEKSGGAYEAVLVMPTRFREHVRILAELGGDPDLLALAARDSLLVSLEHLRGLDPDTTRVRVGARLGCFTPEEARALRQADLARERGTRRDES